MNFDAPPTDPVPILKIWFDAAAAETDRPNPNAMYLGTVDAGGQPSVRTVLLKSFDANGAVFYTNRESRKGEALAANPRAALLFHWDSMDRQIRIEGDVTHVADEESDKYFNSRHPESRLGAWASPQSRPVESRAVLEASVDDYRAKFGDTIPRPPHWGGYRVSFNAIEFWQGHKHRVHDRVVYSPDGSGGWTVVRLGP